MIDQGRVIEEQLNDGLLFFFFQAEDGIRDYKVTGVQTCALPISAAPRPRPPAHALRPPWSPPRPVKTRCCSAPPRPARRAPPDHGQSARPDSWRRLQSAPPCREWNGLPWKRSLCLDEAPSLGSQPPAINPRSRDGSSRKPEQSAADRKSVV